MNKAKIKPIIKPITKEQYDADKEKALKKNVQTKEDIIKNQIINFMSFYNFQLDVIKSNLIMYLNNIDKLELISEFKDEDTKPLLDHLTNLGQCVVEFITKHLKLTKN